MAKIFIINHLTDTVSNATAILVPEVEIKSGVNFLIVGIPHFTHVKSFILPTCCVCYTIMTAYIGCHPI